ncbi:MAG: hypothetical protein JSS17_10720 [Proteobacteria bacterium]|nr:hypothetical protein [Pseudomonadota bacterium]
MATPFFFDPLQLWRDAVNRLESDANTLTTDSLKSPELVRTLQQATTVSSGMQQGFDKLLDGYLRRANLPSRKQLAELTQTLERIEQKLDRLLPPADVPRPARTRKPAAAAPVAPVAPTAPTAPHVAHVAQTAAETPQSPAIAKVAKAAKAAKPKKPARASARK